VPLELYVGQSVFNPSAVQPEAAALVSEPVPVPVIESLFTLQASTPGLLLPTPLRLLQGIGTLVATSRKCHVKADFASAYRYPLHRGGGLFALDGLFSEQ